MLCFAYGSNMDCSQMRERCPSASFFCVAKLNGYRLAFSRRSVKRGCGVADVLRSDDAQAHVWGVVYAITSPEDIERLDRLEGVHSGAYVRKDSETVYPRDTKQPLTVSIYVANAEPSPPLPSTEYKNLILGGATFWKLPEDYIASLEQIKTAP
jgi:gamma-glutamylcyclotransferase